MLMREARSRGAQGTTGGTLSLTPSAFIGHASHDFSVTEKLDRREAPGETGGTSQVRLVLCGP